MIGQLSSEFRRDMSALLETNIGDAIIITTKKGKGYMISKSEETTEACIEHFIQDRFGIGEEQFKVLLEMTPEQMRHAIRLRKIEKLKFELAQLENNI